ncbi:hypothetical protein [Nonomuraea endophytica]|uniref:hypothetical protein n=1 Tax=Nonomuraea endophytica TaxID=714136 RepID=UPI0037C7034D
MTRPEDDRVEPPAKPYVRVPGRWPRFGAAVAGEATPPGQDAPPRTGRAAP